MISHTGRIPLYTSGGVIPERAVYGTMAENKLTDLIIRRLKPQEKVKKYADGHGLCFVVSPQGGRWWEYRFRFQGKARVLSLGQYPVVTLAEARQKHLEARKQLEAGIDPAAEKRAKKIEVKAQATTFREVAEDYIEARRESVSKYETERIKMCMRNHLYPALGDRPIGEIDALEILEAVRAIRAKKNGANNMNDAVQRCGNYAGHVFMHAIRHKLARHNPVAELKGAPELKRIGPSKHQRSLTTEADFGRLLADIAIKAEKHKDRDDYTALKALWLAPYAALRPGELAGGQWSEIDLEGAVWRIPPERMKMKDGHIVPLAPQVVEYLKALKEQTGWSKFLFPARQNDGKTSINAESIRKCLNDLGYSKTHAAGGHTSHGFRASFSTLVREKGFASADIHVELQLAHIKRNDVQAAYDHAKYIPERRAMMARWADYVDRLRSEALAEMEGPHAEAAN